MSLDQRLIATIKETFAGKSAADLQELVRLNDQVRWSPEAIAAANEVLRDRAAGKSQEPVAPERMPRFRPPPPDDPYDLAFMVGANVIGLALGFVVIPRVVEIDPDDPRFDIPLPFGSKSAWVAVATTDTDAVAAALGLNGTHSATWRAGIAAAGQSSVFVTPPLGEWTLAVGAKLFPPHRTEDFVKPLLERLSRQFGDAQYFCSHQDVGLHIWARARRGQLVRGYGWRGDKNLTLWNEGTPTRDERDLGFQFRTGPPTAVAPAKDLPAPDESCVMQLAYLWSIDPTTLDSQFKEPLMGLLGDMP